jgi:hypothetical protein
MVADEGSDQAGQKSQCGDVEAHLTFDLVADFACAFDHDNAFEAWPLVALLQPVDVVNDGDVPGLDAPVIAIDRPVVADGCVAEIFDFLLVGEKLNVFTQRAWLPLRARM